jgi:hypothetical protein
MLTDFAVWHTEEWLQEHDKPNGEAGGDQPETNGETA